MCVTCRPLTSSLEKGVDVSSGFSCGAQQTMAPVIHGEGEKQWLLWQPLMKGRVNLLVWMIKLQCSTSDLSYSHLRLCVIELVGQLRF